MIETEATTRSLRNEIAELADIPANLLTGETEEEIIAQAKALNAYRNERQEQAQQKTTPQTNAEKFGEWIQSQSTAISGYYDSNGLVSNTPPAPDKVMDGGELTRLPKRKSNALMFAQWISNFI